MTEQEKTHIINRVVKFLNSKNISVDYFFNKIRTDEILEKQKNCEHSSIEINHNRYTGSESYCRNCAKRWGEYYVLNPENNEYKLKKFDRPNYF